MIEPEAGESEAGGDRVKSVGTLFEILEHIHNNGPTGVTELSRELGLSKGGIHRYLRTLVEQGYALNDGGTYDLGLRFLTLGGHVRQSFPHSELIGEKVAELAAETGQRGQFLAEEHGYGVYLYRERGTQAANFEAVTGKIVHLHTTAAGKAILAHLPEDDVQEIIETHGLPAETENSITEPAELFAALKTVREAGYAVNREEHLVGLHAVGVPVFDADEEILGGLSVSGPSHRIEELLTEEAVQGAVLSVAEETELEIKYP